MRFPRRQIAEEDRDGRRSLWNQAGLFTLLEALLKERVGDDPTIFKDRWPAVVTAIDLLMGVTLIEKEHAIVVWANWDPPAETENGAGDGGSSSHHCKVEPSRKRQRCSQSCEEGGGG